MSFFFKKKATKSSDVSQNIDFQVTETSMPSTVSLSVKKEDSAPLPYDPSNIFLISKSEDGHLQLFRDLFCNQSSFRLFFTNTHKNILITKEYSTSANQTKSVFNYSFCDSGFAVVIDTYFSDNPHVVLDFFLYDNLGKELLHIYYQSQGIRKFMFSESGRYFIILDHTNFYVYDMEQKNLNIFSPEDMNNSDFSDFIIFEEKQLIAYCYTQHPDKPFYHFAFSGRLVEENVFRSQVDKMNELDTESQRYYTLFDEIDATEKPLSSKDYEKYMTELKSYASNPKYADSAWLYRKMGELELDVGNKNDALTYFEKALSLNSQVGVKRLVTKLKKELED